MKIKNSKMLKITIITTGVVVIVMGGITVKKYTNEIKPQQTFVVTGLPKNQSGILKELEKVTNEHAYIKKGYKYLESREYDKAKEQFETVIKRNKPTGALSEARRGMIDLYEKIGDYRMAAELFSKIIATFKIAKGNMWRLPDDERLLYLLYAADGDYDLAVEHAQRALEADAKLPNRPKGGRADYIQRFNELKEAKDYILSLRKGTPR